MVDGGKTLSTGLDVPMRGREVVEGQQGIGILGHAGNGGAEIARYFSVKTVRATRAAAFVSAWWMSCSSEVIAGAMGFGNLFRTFEILEHVALEWEPVLHRGTGA